jgi:hypothetical protein
MTWIKWILAYLFDCVHPNTSWPQRGRSGLDYVCCLDCGRELPYSTRLMSVVSEEEQLADQSQYGWAQVGNVRFVPSNAKLSMNALAR